MQSLENEIFTTLRNIHNDPDNKDRYGQTSVFEYREAVIEASLSRPAFDYLNTGKSVYGTFSTYTGKAGTYRAVTLTNTFYKELKK